MGWGICCNLCNKLRTELADGVSGNIGIALGLARFNLNMGVERDVYYTV